MFKVHKNSCTVVVQLLVLLTVLLRTFGQFNFSTQSSMNVVSKLFTMRVGVASQQNNQPLDIVPGRVDAQHQ